MSLSAAHHRLLALATGGLLALALLAPGAAYADGDGSTSVPPGQAWVRVGHFVPGMGATSIEVQALGGTTTTMELAGHATYGNVSSYEKLAPGSYTVTVRKSGESATSAPMLSRSFEIDANQAKTVAVLGTASAPRLALLSDNLTPPQAGTARVRLLSASDLADTVTVSAVDGPTIAQDAVQGQATDYTTVPAGSWTLQLQSDMANATLQSVAIASGSVYTVVVLDAGAQQVKLDVVTDAAGAVSMPQGGAETGLGGMAPHPHDAATGADGAVALAGLGGLVVTLLAAAGAATTSRRRRVRLER